MNNKRIKIVYLISTLSKTGPVNVLYNIVKNLNKDTFNITIVTLSPENDSNSLWNKFKKLDITLLSLNLSRMQGYFCGSKKLNKILLTINPDIIHTHCFRSNALSAIFLNKYKRFSTIHCDYVVDFVKEYGIIGYFMAILNTCFLYFIQNNICCSEQLAKILNKKYKYINFTYINNGVDTEEFYPIKDKFIIRKKLKLPLNKKIFIWANRFINGKNPKYFVNTILQDISRTNFYILCGDGEFLSDCRNTLKTNNNVLFTGNIDNISEYMQASDYLISTSSTEGLPMAVLEAGACGLPCLLSDISQHNFLFKYNKNIGELFNLDIYDSLYFAMHNLKQKNYEKLSKNIFNMINNNFTAKIMTKSYEKLYERGINKCN